jgi:hypothetical protein
MSFYTRAAVASAILFVCQILFSVDSRAVSTGTQFALVIGNSAYEASRLLNPVNDANDMATALRSAGFNVTLGKDLDIRGMRLLIQGFLDKLPAGATVFFFYSGHGVQYAGQNYLIPVGAISAIKAPSDLDRESVVMSDPLEEFDRAGNSVTVVFLDACRNSPFSSIADIKSGLSRNTPRVPSSAQADPTRSAKVGPQGALISYSTAPNAVALDGNGRNSPYTRHLKLEIVKPNTSLEQILKNTRSAVTKETSGAQTPWYESSISGDVFPAGQNRIAVEDFFKAFLPDVASTNIPNAHYLMSWDPDGLSPVIWRRIESDADSYKIDDLEGHVWSGPFQRRGEVVLTTEGQPTHYVVEKTRQPVRWGVTLVGPHGGVNAVGLSDNVLSRDFAGFSTQKFLTEDKRCQKGGPTGGQRLFTMQFPNKHSGYLVRHTAVAQGDVATTISCSSTRKIRRDMDADERMPSTGLGHNSWAAGQKSGIS